jgi:hypothetical protein
MRLSLTALALAVMLASPARAAPLPNADLTLKPWFESLKDKDGNGCCALADCRPVEARPGPSGYQAFIEGAWRDIPADAVLDHRDNPTGHAIACWTYAGGSPHILCFVRATET